MLELTNLWWWAPLLGVLGAGAGILVSWKFPGTALRARVHRWRGKSAFFIGLIMSLLAVWAVNRLIAQWPLLAGIAKTVAAPIAAMAVAYVWSRRPDGPPQFLTNLLDWLNQKVENKPPPKTTDAAVERMVFRADWNARPRFETSEEGLFVGRNELLGRLSSHFISKGGGTILISGVRGVGKTSLVDRALVEARRKLADRYWEELAAYLKKRAWIWRPIDMLVRRNLMTLGELSATIGTETQRSATQAGEQARRGAELYLRRPGKTFLRHFNFVRKRIRKMWQASNSQLFVLKFSASDIAGALAEPDQKTTGKPRMDPEKLLRSVIRKLHATCHPSGPKEEAQILQWSLCPKKLRRAFFDDLQKAFDKSISKSYKEIISNSINDFVKQQWTIESQSKFDPVRIIIAAAVFLVVLFGVYQFLPKLPFFTVDADDKWKTLTSGTISTIAGVLATYFTWSITANWSRTSGSDSQRQAQFSYENDYSLARMQSDLESLLRTLSPAVITGFNPYQCFTRSTIVFDELDKLDNAEKQLDDVITHFKNFFTLSNSVFVFLTDHQFYEHLIRETTRAQLARHYSPQHTFFNEKIYLRKPEFTRFREAFYNFTSHDWILKRVESVRSDPALINYLLLNGEATTVINSLQLTALTHFYIHRNEYSTPLREAIETRFDSLGGHQDPLALAEIWASQARGDAEKKDRDKTEADFRRTDGWADAKAVALLYYCRADFIADEQQAITKAYDALGKPPLTEHESVKGIPFSLGDLAQALCFQTRNHYFDLYQFVYDYISDYHDGAPVISLDDKNFAQETRLSSRYQRLIEIAFESVKENHPSREYFNSLLMESLYAVFDKRGNGQAVKVSDVLFQANRSEPPVKPGPSKAKAKAVTPEITAFNARDVQKINQAIIRLLRLALAHNAISSSTPHFESVLKSEDSNKFADLQFEWKDDVQSIIKVTDKEPYEHELIRFWNENKEGLEALDAELDKLWKNLAMPGDATKMRSAIRDLRSKTESVRLSSIKISDTDAEMLKANVKTPEFRQKLMRTTILERIRVEEDAHILDVGATLSPSDPTVAAQLEARKRDFETATHLPLQAVISPVDTGCFVFLTSAPLPDGPPNWTDFPKKNDFVLWYAPVHKEISDTEEVWFYAGPDTASKLVDDYRSLATQARLNRLGLHLQASEYKDATLARRAGAETMGYIGSGSEFQRTLSRPAIEVAISLLDKAKKDFIEQQVAVWQSYQIDPPVSGQDATSKLAAYVVKLSTNEKEPLTFNLTTAVEDAIKQSLRVDIADANADTWLKVFASGSSRAGQFDKWVLEDVVEQLFDERLTTLLSKEFDTALHQDGELRNVVKRELAAWSSQAIVDLANTKGIELKKMLSVSDWAGDLEIQRRSFRSHTLPAQPAQQTTLRQTLNLGRLKRRRPTAK